MKKHKTILKFVSVIGMILTPTFSMDKDCDDLSRQLSIDGWEIVENTNTQIMTVDNPEDDFELKAKALGNTIVTFVEGAGIGLLNFGANVIENTIQRNVNRFENGVMLGSLLAGNVYGQGLAFQNAYENEKEKLKNK